MSDDEVIQLAECGLAEGRVAAALRASRHVTRRQDVMRLRAQALGAAGCPREATELGMRLEAAGVRDPDLYMRLAWSCLAGFGAEPALAWMRKAMKADAHSVDAVAGTGALLYRNARPIDAEPLLRQALAAAPEHADAATYLGHCLLEQGRCEEAEAIFESLAKRDDASAGAFVNLGLARVARRSEREAADSFEEAIARAESGSVATAAFVNLATAFRDLGCIQKAARVFESHLPSHPDAYALLAYAQLLLLLGRFREGWAAHEARWLNDPLRSNAPVLPVPMWRGQGLSGQWVLLRYEQGAGDMIQFVRYAPLVRAMGGRTIFSVPYEFAEFAECFDGIDHVLKAGDRLPDVDWQVPLLSLPLAFGHHAATVPRAVPYLHVPRARADRWAERAGPRDVPRVGVVWAGNPQHPNDAFRSASLAVLAPLLRTRGIRFLSLQKGPAETESDPEGVRLERLGPELEDWIDTAAVVQSLDLVICVDTAVAHLAGALGKPVWLMLPSPPDWRWLLSRDDSPWYPTMRLFRQSARGDWNDVAARLTQALTRWRDGENEERRPAEMHTAAFSPPDLASLVPAHGIAGVAHTRYGTMQARPDDAEGRSLLWYGEWRQRHLDLLSRLVHPGMTVVESGAGVGSWSVFLAKRVDEHGRLFLFEDRSTLRPLLQANLALHGCGNASLLAAAPPGAQADDCIAVDDLALSSLSLIVVHDSADGRQMLEGAREAIWRQRPLLFLSVPGVSRAEAMARFVRDFGYRCWQMDAPLFVPDNFNRRKEDIFDGAAGVALLAVPEEAGFDIAFPGIIDLH